jgi:hypothetical protein
LHLHSPEVLPYDNFRRAVAASANSEFQKKANPAFMCKFNPANTRKDKSYSTELSASPALIGIPGLNSADAYFSYKSS